MGVRLQPPIDALPPRRDLALEGLRGLCALLVAYAHMTVSAPLDPGYMPEALRANFGLPSVIIFFVISGYVIGLTVRGPATPKSIRYYCASRFLRIVPIAWLAIALSVAIEPAPTKVILANMLFLQNGARYPFGISLPVLSNNMSLWSLSNEVLYYALFVLIWKYAPTLRFVIAVGLLLAFAYLLGVPRIVSSYAYFFAFWLVGLCISWFTAPARSNDGSPWVTALAGAAAIWVIGPLHTLFQWFVPPYIGSTYSRFDFIFAAVSVVLAVTCRAPRLQRAVANFCAIFGISILFVKLFRDIPNTNGELLAGLVLAACVLLQRWRPSLSALKLLKPLGSVSYGFYVTAAPLLFLVRDTRLLPTGTLGSFGLRLVVYAILCWCVAWILEGAFQPWFTGLPIIRSLRVHRAVPAGGGSGKEACPKV
jgi:peptidoglycan/LPS O-acetylase OafA/YrhL